MEGGLEEGLTRGDGCTRSRPEEDMDALSFRTRERLEVSKTTPLMVTSRGCDCEGPGPDWGRTVGSELVLEAGVALGV